VLKYKVVGSENVRTVNVAHQRTTRHQKTTTPKLPSVKLVSGCVPVSVEKKSDTRAMMKFMPEVDKTLYVNLFANH